MIHASCISTELLLERGSPELSPDERRRVEQHLAGCERCQREHRLVTSLASLAEERIETQVLPALHDQIFAQARARYARGELSDASAVDGSERPRLPRFVFGGALVCVAVALVIVAFGRKPREQAQTAWKAPIAASATEARRDQLITGELRHGVVVLGRGAAIPDNEELTSNSPVVLQLAHARLEVAKASSLSWSAATRVVTLLDATAQVQVEPTAHRSFRVLTSHFLVDVVGTKFRIDQDTVFVTHGRVHILTRDSKQTLAELGAGQTFTYRLPRAAEETQASASSPSGAEPARPPLGDAKSTLSASELLARARRHLSAGDPRRARADVAAALLATTSRAEQAVAHMIEGDCALVEGNTREAVRKYLDVSRRFPGLPVAETALFSAARVESNAGRKAAARELLRTYLVRYPKGRFHEDADERLRALDAP